MSYRPTLLSHCLTVLLSHCLTVPVSHCHIATVLLSQCPLSYCTTVLLSHCQTVLLSQCHTATTVLLSLYTITLYYCLSYCTTVYYDCAYYNYIADDIISVLAKCAMSQILGAEAEWLRTEGCCSPYVLLRTSKYSMTLEITLTQLSVSMHDARS